MDTEIAALASTAAASVVTLLTTDLWAQAKSEIVAFWRRFRPAQAEVVEADLTEAHDEASTGDEAVIQALTTEWESRLRRLAAADAEAAAELRETAGVLARMLAQTTGQPGATITQHATASGHGTVIQAGRDARIGDVMLGEQRVHIQQVSATDAAVVIQVGRDLYVSDPALSAPWIPGETTPGECPFPGLDAFGPGQSRWFFGRATLTGDLLQMLDDVLRAGSGGLVIVVGPSGAGKSSLLGAGLLAGLGEGRLPASGSESWPRLMITPGVHPPRTLRETLATCAQARDDASPHAVIVVDQMEELFTACEDEAERTEFLDALAGLAATGNLIVAGLRADFYARATGYPVLRAAMQTRQVVLGAMTLAEVREAITRPARSAGLTLDDGLVERLLRDLGVDEVSGYEPGRLPLLAHALRATWQRRSGDRLTIAGYEATGGIHGAIAKTAEGIYTRLDEVGQRAARQLFLALVRAGEATAGTDDEGTADTRRRIGAENLYAQMPDPDAARAVLTAFTHDRLITPGDHTVEITHEALLRRWPRLREWLDEDRAGNLIRQDLEEAAASWDREDRDPAALYGGVRLAAARTWTADPGHQRELSRPARDFLAASDRRRRRGIRRRNGIICVLAALVIALGSLTVFAFSQRTTAQTNFQQAESGVFATAAQAAQADRLPDTAMEFALRAEQLDPSGPGVLSALLGTQTQAFTGRLQTGDPYKTYGVTYSPDGALVAAGSYQYVTLWSANSRTRLANLPVTFGSGFAIVHAVTFSPDSKTLAATGGGGAWLWNVTDPRHPVRKGVLGTGGAIYAGTAVTFSPDGRTLAIAETTASGAPGAVQIWNVSTRTLERTITTGSPVAGLAFAGGGRYLVTAASGGPVQLWNLSRPGDLAALSLGTDTGSALAVSPDGQTVAFSPAGPISGPYQIRLWNLSTHQSANLTTGFGNAAISLAFSEDGGYLAASSLDDTVKLWDLRSGQTPVLLSTLGASRAPVYDISFSPDGNTLASTDGKTVALWNVRGNTLDGRADASAAVASSPDGRLFAVGTRTGNSAVVELYDMPARRLVATLPMGSAGVTALAFSPNGKVLAAAVYTAPATVRIWDVASRRLTGVIATGQQNQVHGMAFSPNSQLLATTSLGDPDVRLWSATRLSRVAVIRATQDWFSAVSYGQWAVSFSPDGRLLAVGGADGTTRLYTLPNGKLAGIYYASPQLWTLAFAPVGRTLAITGTDGNIYLFYDVGPSKSLIHESSDVIPDSSQTVTTLAFEPDGQLIAAGYDGMVRLWNSATGALIASFQASTSTIADLAYSRSTGIIATASNITRVWETNPGKVAAGICPTLRAPVGIGPWTAYVSQYPYTPICG